MPSPDTHKHETAFVGKHEAIYKSIILLNPTRTYIHIYIYMPIYTYIYICNGLHITYKCIMYKDIYIEREREGKTKRERER